MTCCGLRGHFACCGSSLYAESCVSSVTAQNWFCFSLCYVFVCFVNCPCQKRSERKQGRGISFHGICLYYKQSFEVEDMLACIASCGLLSLGLTKRSTRWAMYRNLSKQIRAEGYFVGGLIS